MKLNQHHFRPLPLLPPALNSTAESYGHYLTTYQVYLDALQVHKNHFWTRVKEKVVPTEVGFFDKIITKVRTTGGKGEFFRTEENITIRAPTLVFGRAAPIKPTVVRPTKQQKAEQKERRAAARRRQRDARRLRDLEKAERASKAMVALKANNVVLAKDDKDWVQVTRKGKTLTRASGSSKGMLKESRSLTPTPGGRRDGATPKAADKAPKSEPSRPKPAPKPVWTPPPAKVSAQYTELMKAPEERVSGPSPRQLEKQPSRDSSLSSDTESVSTAPPEPIVAAPKKVKQKKLKSKISQLLKIPSTTSLVTQEEQMDTPAARSPFQSGFKIEVPRSDEAKKK